MNCVHVSVHGVDSFTSCMYIYIYIYIYLYLGSDV